MRHSFITFIIVFLTFTLSSFGQQNDIKRKPAKIVSSETTDKPVSNSVKKKKNQKKASEHKLVSGKKMPADFPKYIDTGNKEKDVATYKAAKLKWINENPEKYKALFTKSSPK
jgi:hypothetical protein